MPGKDDELTALLVLPPDVLLVPVRDLPPAVYNRIEHEEGDYAITRPRGRTPSRVVEAGAATLLKQFIRPATIVEAVIASSYLLKLDPDKMLEDAYPLIRLLVASGMLVRADSPDAEQIRESFTVDQQIHGFQILRCIHCLEDTELYQARHDRHGLAALKIARPGRSATMAPLVGRESAILERLAGAPAPRFFDTGIFEDRPFLAMEWQTGEHLQVVAEELRMESGNKAWQRLLELCCGTVDAYAQLHAAGVIHGDVHGRNILVDGNHVVSLIDFGYSRAAQARKKWGRPERAGIAHFYEPEYASAILRQRPVPPASEASDQYALAAVIYYCLSGSFYLEFSPEKEAMLRQIAEEAPLPLTSRGVRPCPATEKVLSRAFSKRPSQRFDSTAAFAKQLRRAVTSDLKRDQTAIPASRVVAPEQKYLKTILKQFAPESPLFAKRSLAAPIASVGFGAAGIAYSLYRIAGALNDARLLAIADLWIARAEHSIKDVRAFHTEKMTVGITGTVTPWHSASGISCVDALIARSFGDSARQQSAINAFLIRAEGTCDNLDLTLGRSGTLLASAILLESAQPRERIDTTALLTFGNRTMRELWEAADESAFDYFGMAHGWAGLVYATLRCCQIAATPLPAQTEATLDMLAARGERMGSGMRWPVVPSGGGSYMSGWCHGSAGYVHLWTEAWRVTQKTEFLALAEAAAQNAWEVRQGAGHICCGLAGQAYGLLALYQVTHERLWLDRARRLLRPAVAAAAIPEYANSLYKGDAGVAILAAEIGIPDMACMPFFGREGWQ